MEALTGKALEQAVARAVSETPVTDMHTHLYAPSFGKLLLRGIDDLLNYHYLTAELFRWLEMPYERYWALPPAEQASLAWRTLFIEHSPVSESCLGLLTILRKLGLDPASRDLEDYRRFFAGLSAEEHVALVLEKANIRELVMTNDPFDEAEAPAWEKAAAADPRFHASLRLDGLLNDWPGAAARLRERGYTVGDSLDAGTLAQVRRFLEDWTRRINALYLAVSLPPSFRYPEDSPRGTLIAEAVLPVCRELDKPFALMIGVKKLVNPHLRLAGDSVGKGEIDTLERLCAAHPRNRFLATMLARENQHESCVATRKFRNLHLFGCWWFLNMPLFVEEMTRMRCELLGTAFTPQHSDARVLEQLIYKWDHSRTILSRVLAEKYQAVADTGWKVSETEIRRDVAGMLGGNFHDFLSRSL